MEEPDAIEIKVNIGGDVDQTLTALGLNGGKARQVWFLDDLTEGARPPLPLLSAGIVLRLRRRGDNGKEDSTVKLRPCRWSQLTGLWSLSPKEDDPYRIEGDWSKKRRVLAASCVGDLEPGTIERAISRKGQIADAFAETQRDFLTQCGEIRVGLSGVSVLEPIAATQWKDFAVGGVSDVAAERWTVAGLDFLELSIRVTSGTGDAAAQQRDLTAEVLARGLELDASDESKTVRVMKRLAGLD
jgi:hypothetical protein